jgi:hypothetical protein
MRTKLLVAGVVVAAALVRTPCGARGQGATAPLPSFRLPDLVVKAVKIEQVVHSSPLAEVQITVTVRNIGAGGSGPCSTAVYMLYPPPGSPTGGADVFGAGNTPQIPPGHEANVVISRPWSNLKTSLLAVVVDAPIGGRPLGTVRERSKLNNVLAFPYDRAAGLPQTYSNPAVP